jgi:hypothetical protein
MVSVPGVTLIPALIGNPFSQGYFLLLSRIFIYKPTLFTASSYLFEHYRKLSLNDPL